MFLRASLGRRYVVGDSGTRQGQEEVSGSATAVLSSPERHASEQLSPSKAGRQCDKGDSFWRRPEDVMPRNELDGLKRGSFSRDGTQSGGHRESGARPAAAEGEGSCILFLHEHSIYYWRRGRPHVARAVEAGSSGWLRASRPRRLGADSAICCAIPGKASPEAAGKSRIAGANDARHATSPIPRRQLLDLVLLQ